jgi:hypothetical protein
MAAAAGGDSRAAGKPTPEGEKEGRLTSGPRANLKLKSKPKSAPKLIRSKRYYPSLQHFERKYQEMWFEVRNKLCHWSFFKFEKEFELKIRESKGIDFF